MTRSKRSLVLLAIVALAVTLASRNDLVVRSVTDLIGPRVSLFVPARVSLQGEAGAAHDPRPEAPAAVPAVAPAVSRTSVTVPSASATITVQPGAKLELGYVLEAQLVMPNGKPLNDAKVRFYESAELLGPREMLIGTAVSDGQGRASLAYLPAKLGDHEIIVRSPARDQLAPAEGRMTFAATVAAAPYRPEHLPLSAFSAGVPYAVGVLVLGVWGLIAFSLFGTARSIGAGANAPARVKPSSLATAATKTRTRKREDLA